MASDLEAVGRSRPVDLVIREPWEFGGAIAAGVLGVPCVLHGIGPVANVEEVLTIAGGRLSEHARTLGTAEDLWGWLGGELYLDACPPLLQSLSATFGPRRRQLLRPQVFDATDGVVEPPGWLADRIEPWPELVVTPKRRSSTYAHVLTCELLEPQLWGRETGVRGRTRSASWVGTVRWELVDHSLIFGRRPLVGVLEEFLAHYQGPRPHQGLDQYLPTPHQPTQHPLVARRIVRHDRLGGLLHEYSWAA